MNAVETQGLSKRYGAVRAVEGLDLRVPAGSLFGFLGPNGAGKTTTIRMLMGLLRPSAGSACVLGRDIRRDSVDIRRRVGYLPGDLRLYEGLIGRALLDFAARTRGIDCHTEISRLAERLELDLSRRIRGYSRGMKQKLGLIAALMHRPEMLILDEPTTALDPLVQHVLCDELRAAARRGTTVLFSSHVLAEVESLCEQVAIVRAGRLVEHDRIENLRTRAARRVEFTVVNGQSPEPPAGLRVRTKAGGRIIGAWSGPVQPLVRWLADSGAGDVTIGPPDLEELFLAYYGDGAEAANKTGAAA